MELFHRLADPDSAEVRRLTVALGLEGRVAFRNVGFASHEEALRARGGGRIPALWDGTRLHEGIEAVREILEALARG